eukprot:s656_g34.t1
MDKTKAASRGSMEVLDTLPMSLTLKLKVGKHRICSHVELGSLEVQLTAIMSSLSILEHCHSQMKGTWQANMLNSSIQELSALRHLVLKFARRLPLLEAEESTSSDNLARWAGGFQLEEPHQMRVSSSSEDSVSCPMNGVPSAPTSATSITSQQSGPALKDKSSCKSSSSSGSPAANAGDACGASVASSRGEKTKGPGRFRAPRILSVMKGLLSRKQTRVQTLNNHSDDDDDDDNHGIDSESDNEGMDVMSSVVPHDPVPPNRVFNAVPPRSPCRDLAGRLQNQRRS